MPACRQRCSGSNRIGAERRPQRTRACPGCWTQEGRAGGIAALWDTMVERSDPAYPAGGGSWGSSWGAALL
eukprot:1349991-Pleurochrysis_carterae.AAC.1